MYVTFILRPIDVFADTYNHQTLHFAVKVNDESEALDASSYIYGIEQATHVRINKCGRLRKNTHVFNYNQDGNAYETQVYAITKKEWNFPQN